ncbi:MAG: RNA methyltransferase [Nitrospirae bacterium]|nr:RNA methyltransferase [Nitrospirota bacterium]
MITSVSNPKIKEAISVKRDKGNAFFVEGLKIVLDAMNSGAVLKQLFYTSENVEVIEKVKTGTFEVIEVSAIVMNKLTDTKTPQGIVAIVQRDVKALNDIVIDGDALVVVCDRVSDPGNCGSIIRAADAFGASAVVVLPQTCNPFSPKVVRASAGSIFNVPVVDASIDELLKWLSQRGIMLAVTLPHSGVAINEVDLTQPFALVVGEESKGICQWLIETAPLLIKIPTIGKAESLNVAACTSICLYEAQLQRGEKRKRGGSASPQTPPQGDQSP